MSGRRREEKTSSLNRTLFLSLAGLVTFLDQLTKALAKHFLGPGTTRPVIPHVFHLTLLENRGIAFGLFQGAEKLLLGIISASILALLAVGCLFPPSHRKTQLQMSLILGGALGNWIDRIATGAVVDFLDFRIWPVFNLADTAISIGVGLFFLDLIRHPKKHVA